jgi:hypothetical protein
VCLDVVVVVVVVVVQSHKHRMRFHLLATGWFDSTTFQEHRFGPRPQQMNARSLPTDNTSPQFSMTGYKNVAGMFQHNYPERLAAAHSAPTPSWIRGLWMMFKYIFDPETRQKVHLHANIRAFANHIALDQLPLELGGTNPAPITAEAMTVAVRVLLPTWDRASSPLPTGGYAISAPEAISRPQALSL